MPTWLEANGPNVGLGSLCEIGEGAGSTASVVAEVIKVERPEGDPMRDAPLESSLWYRVADLRPRLVARARLHRHRTGRQPETVCLVTSRPATAFSNCHGKLWARMRPWQGLSISLWVRVLVAKSHLASKLVFQASFLQPTATHLQAAQRAIRCFVASPSTPGEDSHPSQLHPSEIVCSLLWVDLSGQLTGFVCV